MPAFSYYSKTPSVVDISGYTPVSVVANFNTEGKFIPVYVQIEEDYEKITIKIEQVKRAEDKMGVVQFDCTYKDGDYLKNITLYYIISKSTWAIKK
ncbi:MAG TPA: hypothetical protein DCW90_06455 [Lachnospiraceae bacterium]|nr:hypothetical protein [uncultured Lachnoclostridium sp.]HAU85140.1 hypothetical protein [Lachnospiraceae bacterium]